MAGTTPLSSLIHRSTRGRLPRTNPAIARVLKHIRDPHLDPYLKEWLRDCVTLYQHSDHAPVVLEFIATLLHYVTGSGNVIGLKTLVEDSQRLPHPIGGTFMTIAEQLKAEGEARGKIEGKIETARNLLKEGVDPQFVAKVTGLSLDDVMRLQEDAK